MFQIIVVFRTRSPLELKQPCGLITPSIAGSDGFATPLRGVALMARTLDGESALAAFSSVAAANRIDFMT